MSSDESENENVQSGLRGYQLEPEFTEEELEAVIGFDYAQYMTFTTWSPRWKDASLHQQIWKAYICL